MYVEGKFFSGMVIKVSIRSGQIDLWFLLLPNLLLWTRKVKLPSWMAVQMLPELITWSILLIRGGAIVQPQHILGWGGGVIETLFCISCFVISEALGVLMVACMIVWGVTVGWNLSYSCVHLASYIRLLTIQSCFGCLHWIPPCWPLWQ